MTLPTIAAGVTGGAVEGVGVCGACEYVNVVNPLMANSTANSSGPAARTILVIVDTCP